MNRKTMVMCLAVLVAMFGGALVYVHAQSPNAIAVVTMDDVAVDVSTANQITLNMDLINSSTFKGVDLDAELSLRATLFVCGGATLGLQDVNCTRVTSASDAKTVIGGATDAFSVTFSGLTTGDDVALSFSAFASARGGFDRKFGFATAIVP